MTDIDLLLIALDGESDRVSALPIVFKHTDTMHFAKRSGAEDLCAARLAGPELESDKLGHILDRRRDSSCRCHCAGIYERHLLTRSVRHTPSVPDGKSRNIAVNA